MVGDVDPHLGVDLGLVRGTLARLDRRLLAGLGRDERFQMVRVPVTSAKWSTWKRYRDTAGISMGRGIAALIHHELVLLFDHSTDGAVSLFEEWAQQQMADREAALAKREHELGAAEERVRRRSDHLREGAGARDPRVASGCSGEGVSSVRPGP